MRKRHASPTAAPARIAMMASYAVLLLLAAAGCVSTPPPPPPAPGVEIPAHWSAAVDTAATRPGPGWWGTFDDPRLDALVRRALANNLDLAAAAARIAQAQAEAVIAGADRYPQLDAAIGVSRARETIVAVPVPSGAGITAQRYGVSLNATWEVDLWNRLAERTRSAVSLLQATRADYAAARLSLAAQTARLYFSVIAAEQALELARQTLDIRQSTAARVRRRYEAGLVPPLDLRLALTNEASAAVLVAARERELDRLARQLEVLLGAYPRGTFDGAEELPELAPIPDPGVPSELLVRRPDLVAAELRIEAAGAQVAAARAALLPQIRLTGSFGRQAGDFGDLFVSAFNVWSLAADLLAPLFQGGRLRAQVGAARAELAKALAAYRDLVLESFLEVETALAANRFYAAEVEAALALLRQAEAAARLARDRYGAGLIDLLALLEAERQRLDAVAQALSARLARVQARVDLHVALGGGFDAR